MESEKPVIWVGASLECVRSFPEDVQDEIGYVLGEVQQGRSHRHTKPLKGFSGVHEIVSNYRTDTYRAVYALKLGEAIYVLHAFQKKSKKGIATPPKDIDIIKQRLKTARQIAKELDNE